MSVGFNLLLFFLFFIHGSIWSGLSVKERVYQIPLEDRVELESFFKGMLLHGEVAEVLLDKKPSALLILDWGWKSIKNARIVQESFLFYRGYKIWKKHMHVFPDQKFTWIEDKKNRSFFRLWFVKKASVERVNNVIAFSKSSVEIRRELGFVLGYPKEDVGLFYKWQRLQKTLMFFPYDSKFGGARRRIGGIEIMDLENNLLQDPIAELLKLQENNYPRAFYTSEGPFFPAKIYHRFTSKNTLIGQKIVWKKKVADLYNSENFLEEILTILEQNE